MKNVEAVRYKQRLDHLFERVVVLSGDIELQAHWARYLCILVSGFVETSVRAIYSRYARDKASPNVANYVDSRLRRFTNPNMEDILQLSGAFSSNWRQYLEQTITSDVKDAVDSIVANRVRMAHGEDVGITYIRVKDYYQRVVKLLDTIEDTCA